MGQVLVRDVDDEVIAAHARRAAVRGVSLEDELRELLRSTATPASEALLERMDRSRALTPATKRTPVAEVVRDIRDEA
jgi:plasmid stability protein